MIPPLFFYKEPIPEITHPDLQRAIDEVKAEGSQADALRKAFSIVDAKFVGLRFRTYFLFWRAWETDPNKLWERQGFLHCTQQNYLLRVLLIQSHWFTENDIKLGFSFVWHISPHQYLKVRVKENWLAADPWNADYGAVLGTYASGFGFQRLKESYEKRD